MSSGIPDCWGAAAVVYALIEGLAGIKDIGAAYDQTLLTPRWESAGVSKVSATAKIEASGGYVSYEYAKNSSGNKITLTFTGSCKKTKVKMLLPDGRRALSVLVNGKEVKAENEKIEDSRYVVFDVKKPGVHTVNLELKS